MLVGLPVTLFSDEILISTKCIVQWFYAQLEQKILDNI